MSTKNQVADVINPDFETPDLTLGRVALLPDTTEPTEAPVAPVLDCKTLARLTIFNL